ncbi:unnamed protein product [Prorocentrum cordatum]|uniref:Uncharacterized protein n=1 Tax=Prorocentrum cordatum TaxID=2364126 RepID=A0ABN9X4P9_9DINO|nr:unnamed protein product [Polarella glacialis]
MWRSGWGRHFLRLRSGSSRRKVRARGGLALAEAGRLSVVLYAGQTLLGLRLTQCGSATQRSIAAVTAVPLASALFTSRRLMSSPGAESYTGNSAQGLVLCLLGFAVYIQGRHLR